MVGGRPSQSEIFCVVVCRQFSENCNANNRICIPRNNNLAVCLDSDFKSRCIFAPIYLIRTELLDSGNLFISFFISAKHTFFGCTLLRCDLQWPNSMPLFVPFWRKKNEIHVPSKRRQRKQTHTHTQRNRNDVVIFHLENEIKASEKGVV